MNQLTRREHILRQVISSLVVAAVLAVASYFIPGLWAYLGGLITVPRWWYWFLLLFFALTLLGILVVAAFIVLGPEWRRYREDRFLGLVWRWEWSPLGHARDIWCYCPRCDRPMVYDTRFDHDDRVTKTRFECRACGTPLTRPGTKNDTINEVRAEIDLKIRHNTWRQAVTP